MKRKNGLIKLKIKKPNGHGAVKGILFDMAILAKDKTIKKLFKEGKES